MIPFVFPIQSINLYLPEKVSFNDTILCIIEKWKYKKKTFYSLIAQRKIYLFLQINFT